jgi:2-methylcitrate dehydratase PrpD
VTPLTRLAERLAGLEPERLSADLLDLARQRLFDHVASFNAGSYLPEAELLRRICYDTGIGPGQISERDLLLMSGVTRSTEIDDIDIRSCATVGAIVVPAALVAARAVADCGALRLLGGIVAGYEAMVGFGRVISGALRLGTGYWPTHLAAPIGASAAAAQVFGWDAGRTAHALAIALNRTAGLGVRAAGDSSPRWLVIGASATDGYLAARAAGAGVQGDLEILDALARRLGEPFDPGALVPSEEDGWRISEVDAKPFRTARQACAATDAFVRLRAGRRGGSVAAVEAFVPEQVLGMVNQPYPAGYSRRLGVQYQLALATIGDCALYDLTEAARTREQPVREVMDKVRVEPEAGLTARFPEQWGARVVVSWDDGSSEQLEVLDPTGSAASPMSWEELAAKHERVLAATTAGAGQRAPAGSISELLAACRTAGPGSGVDDLIPLLRLTPGA